MKLTLAQAIRKGCKLVPKQCTDGSYVAIGPEPQACALACAYIGWKIDSQPLEEILLALKNQPRQVDLELREAFEEIRKHSVFRVLVDMNDEMEATREEIADWIEAQEKKRKKGD